MHCKTMLHPDALAGLFVFSGRAVRTMVVATVLGGCHPDVEDHSNGTHSELVAAAVREALDGTDRDDARNKLMQSREFNIPKGDEPWDDGYPSWLAAWLIRRAADGTLFVKHDGKLCLWMPLIGGDSAFGYIGSIARIHRSDEKSAAGGPWRIWRYYGRLVTPDPDDPPGKYSQEHYALAGVSPGDLVEIDIYRVSKVRFDLDNADLTHLIENSSARLVLRLQVPVVVKP